MKEKACIKIYGKVQGVYFRVATKEKAKDLNINGFVENLDNGAVYIEAEGAEENLKTFIEWCHKGPSSADVENLTIEYREKTGFSSFQIRY